MKAERVFMVLVVVCLAVSVGFGTRHSNGQRLPALRVDGGRPVPADPPPPPSAALAGMASHAAQVLNADGGRRMPPYSPSNSAGQTLRARISCAGPILEADGGRPVPPYPPGPSMAAGKAVGNSTAA